MTLDHLLVLLRSSPLVASVQASEGSPVDDGSTLLRLAQASVQEGVKVLRLQGEDNIRGTKAGTSLPVIGLIKRGYPGSEVYITPTSDEVKALLGLGCEVIALDGTRRSRPGGSLPELIGAIHQGGAIAMADCDSLDSAKYALESGADLIGTTLAGYTAERAATDGPDLELLRALVALNVPVIAEGRYGQRWHVEAALRIGASAVVVGGALNDPIKQTRALSPHWPARGKVGAVDIGGTCLRFGVFSPDWQLLGSERIENPPKREDRLAWIREIATKQEVTVLGVGTGGIIDPSTGVCWAAKEYLMPDQIGIEFSEQTLGLPTFTHGDGHATAWGHACLPQFAGRRVATLALGTGVGCGFVQDGHIWAGRRGEYPRINDLPTSNGATYEDVLGGINLTREPSEDQKHIAVQALEDALFTVRNLYFPDDVVVAGSVGLSEWMRPHLDRLDTHASPFGTDAGLYGAAALALFPPA
jgi:putative N-acetylmannosamine-6-phosphate epimerase/predicted NBD/HSP70 family sugar kinase